jgi:hypothetical protein
MPGFNIGGSGDGPSYVTETRRKHRWRFKTLWDFSREILILLQKANRPSVSFEEPAMHHDQEQVYFAGKQTWEPISLAWYDAVQPQDVSEKMWEWVNSVCDIPNANVASPDDYKKKDASLEMMDNTGTADETWKLHGCWPKEINWGEINYTDTELQLVEVTMRFDRANRE